MNIERDTLKYLPLPEATSTFRPVPHDTCLQICQPLFEEAGYGIQREEITIARDGLVMACRFVMGHEAFSHIKGYTPQVIILNGNTRQHRFRTGVGLECLVCSNGMFVAERQFARKHTRNILHDLPQLVRSVIEESRNWFDDYLMFLYMLKSVVPTRIETNEILMASAEQGIIPSSQIMQVWRTFKDPLTRTMGGTACSPCTRRSPKRSDQSVQWSCPARQ